MPESYLATLLTTGVLQEDFDRLCANTVMRMEEVGVPIEEVELVRRQWQGGKCPVCHRDYRPEQYECTFGGALRARFTLHLPACKC